MPQQPTWEGVHVDDRWQGSRSRRRSIVAAVLLLAFATPAWPAPLAAAPAFAAPAVGRVPTDVRDDAAQAAREARLVRSETRALLTGFLTEFGPRFTAEESERLRGYRATADRQLAGVVVTTRRLQSTVAAGRGRTEVAAAARAAQRAHQRARAAADVTYEAARGILEPRLSLLEGISAIRDYDAMLGRFDRLGERIAAVAATSRAAG